MHKGVAVGIIIVLLVVGFGVYQVAIKNSPKENQTTTQENRGEPKKTDTTIEKSKSPSSLRELLSSGQSRRCTFSSTADDTVTDGTIFAASGKMRGDISTTTSEKSFMSHMIVRNNEVYIWMDGETNGMKMTVDSNNIQDEETKQQAVDLDEKIDYQCSGWVGDPTLFEVPSSVTFTNLTSLEIPITTSSGSSESMMGGDSSPCAACESLDGEAKSQCQTALSCR